MRALRLLTHILDSKTASFAPAGFRDRYEEALLAHLRAKQRDYALLALQYSRGGVTAGNRQNGAKLD